MHTHHEFERVKIIRPCITDSRNPPPQLSWAGKSWQTPKCVSLWNYVDPSKTTKYVHDLRSYRMLVIWLDLNTVSLLVRGNFLVKGWTIANKPTIIKKRKLTSLRLS